MNSETRNGGSTGRSIGVPRRIWSATGLQILGRVWSAVCTLAILKWTAGVLSAEDFGRMTFFLAAFTWLDSLVNLGTGEVAIQRTADDPNAVPSVLKSARRIRLGAGLVGMALVGGGAFVAGEPGAGWILIATLYPLTHTLELSTVVFRNRIAWGVPVAVRAMATTLSMISVAVLVRAGVRQPAIYVLGVAVGSTIGNLGLYWSARKHLPRPAGPVLPATGILKEAWPLGISSVCAMGYFYADNLFIRAIRGDEELGPYNVAVRILSILIMVAQYVSLSALPWLRRSHAEGRLGDALSRFGPWLFALACSGAGMLWPWTEQLLEAFEPGFGRAAGALRWLLAATASIYAGSTLLTAVVATGNNRAKLAIQAGGLALNIAANSWAVPHLGIEGAGMTTFWTEAFVALGAAIVLARRGVTLFRGGRWLAWCVGPILFVLTAWLSSLALLQ